MSDPRAADGDLTAKAKIRNAALDLYAEHGEDRVSMRQIAAAAGVTVGLVQHHFKTKEGIRDAVDQLVVDYHASAIADAATPDGGIAEVSALRDRAVSEMLEANPAVLNYLRRQLLDPSSRSRLLARLTELSRAQVMELRDEKLASTDRSIAEQAVGLMVRQLGQLFLQPMVDAMWDQLAPSDPQATTKPPLTVSARTT